MGRGCGRPARRCTEARANPSRLGMLLVRLRSLRSPPMDPRRPALPPPSDDRVRRLGRGVKDLGGPLPPAAGALPEPAPLDVRQPPFGELDFAWMNGSNPQPASQLTRGPVPWSLYVDPYYAWKFHAPA